MAIVELERVGPAGEVRIAAVGQDLAAGLRRQSIPVVRFTGQVVRRAADVELGVRLRPRMIETAVIRHEVEQQFLAAFPQSFAQPRQRFSVAEVGVQLVAGDGEGRATNVVLSQVGQNVSEVAQPVRLGTRDLSARRPRSARRRAARPSRTLVPAKRSRKASGRSSSVARRRRTRESSFRMTRVLNWISDGKVMMFPGTIGCGETVQRPCSLLATLLWRLEII